MIRWWTPPWSAACRWCWSNNRPARRRRPSRRTTWAARGRPPSTSSGSGTSGSASSPSSLAGLERQRTATYRPSRLRLEGYAAAIEDAGLSWADVPVYEAAENAPEQGRIAAGVLLSREPRPTAILTLSDQLALGVFEAAKKMGLSIPEDLSVVGFDDVPEASRTEPALTTVYQPHVEKGLIAGRMLVAQLRGEELQSPEPLPTRLVVRGSTAPPKAPTKTGS